MLNAVYQSKSGKVFYLQARPHFLLSEWEGANIDHYEILRQDSDCRRSIGREYKSMKIAFEVLEKLLKKNEQEIFSRERTCKNFGTLPPRSDRIYLAGVA